MLIIRQRQVAAFESAALGRLEIEILANLRDTFAIDVELAGERAIRRFVRHAVRRADAHGMRTKGQFYRYAVLAIMFGSHFDRDPLLPWAAKTLGNLRLTVTAIRMDRLDQLAHDCLERVAGAEGEHCRKALQRARRLPFEEYASPAAEAEAAMWALLERLYPEQYANAPDAGRAEFAELALDRIRQSWLAPEEGALVLPALMFLLGTHALDDPLYSWVRAALGDAELTKPGARERALHVAFTEYLERVLTLLGEEGGGQP